jgi:hypothetical protein
MAEWQEAARKEVNRIGEIENAGLQNRRFLYQNTSTPQTSTQKNNGPVPMDVDVTTTSPIPFKKLTEEERDQYRKEGRCFRCREKGHMARNCPKNDKPKARAATTETPAPPDTKVNAITLTKAQQIRALEEAMTEEERGEYLDTRDGGEDFYDAGL